MSDKLLAPPSREEMVAHCAALMTENTWERGVTGKGLAKVWGLHPQTVREIAAEASRRVVARVTDKTRLAVFAVGTLEKVASAAVSASTDTSGETTAKERAAERANAVRALTALLTFTREDSGHIGAGWEALSSDERHRRLDEIQVRIDAARATLPPRAIDVDAEKNEETPVT